MTLKEFTDTATHEERALLAKKLNTWLGIYTYEVRKYALSQIDKILSDPTALYLLDELYTRTEKEEKEATDNFYWFLGYSQEYRKHCDVLTHSKSYRDVLYDKFLKDRHEEGTAEE